MSVDSQVASKFQKYLHRSETIIETIRNEDFLRTDVLWVCLTQSRIGFLERKNAFSWRFIDIGIDRVTGVSLDERLLKTTIRINIRDHEDAFTLTNVGRSSARDFVGTLSKLIEDNREAMTQRTKICPVCDEIIKYKAKKCKYCGEVLDL